MNRRGDEKKLLSNSDEDRQMKGQAYIYANMVAGKDPKELFKELSGISGITMQLPAGFDVMVTVDGIKPEPWANTISRVLAVEGIQRQPLVLWSKDVDETSKKMIINMIKANGVDMECATY